MSSAFAELNADAARAIPPAMAIAPNPNVAALAVVIAAIAVPIAWANLIAPLAINPDIDLFCNCF